MMGLTNPRFNTGPTLAQMLGIRPPAPGDLQGGMSMMMPGMASPNKKTGYPPFASQMGQVSSGSRAIRSGVGSGFPSFLESLGRR